MDVVICTDSALAYQAAGLGCRTWIVLPEQAQAHWQRGRADSPWYPGVRLFRQQRRGIWEEVVAQVQEALTQLLEESPPPVCREGIHALLLRAARLHADHRPAEAEQLYRQMLADRHVLPPAALAALHEHLSRTGRHQLIEHLKPWHAEDQFWLEDLRARALARKGDNDAAFALWARLVEKSPPALPVYMHYGLALNQAKQYERAIEVWNKAAGMYPSAGLMKLANGISHQEAGKREQAVPHLRRAASLMPLDPDLRLRLGILLREQNHNAESKQHLQAILTIDPHSKSAWDQLGHLVFSRETRPDLGVICFRHSNEIQLGHYSSVQLAYCYFDVREAEKALEALEWSVRFKPLDKGTINFKAQCFQHLSRYHDAIETFVASLAFDPDNEEYTRGVHRQLSGQYLAIQDFENGFHSASLSWERRKLPKPQWKGESLEGKTLLVYQGHGYGDSIQYMRLLRNIKAGKIIYAVWPDLVRFFKGAPGIDELYSIFDLDLEKMDYDYHINEYGLVYTMRIDPFRLPTVHPYLHPDQQIAEKWRDMLAADDKFRIGIVWNGNPNHGGDNDRSSKLSDWLTLADVPGVTFYNLQKDERCDQLYDFPQMRVVDLSKSRKDFADLAAIVSQLDLVISIDSSPVHVAGAVGTPVWNMLGWRRLDWRWLLNRTDAPWYPNMRLWRQNKGESYKEVLLRIKDELIAKLASGELKKRSRDPAECRKVIALPHNTHDMHDKQ
jgi:tetratricopeptide (TPR) repeat protein